METPKQQFNSRSTWALMHLRGREQAPEPFGWTGRQAEWVALACLHGGMFTRARGRGSWTRTPNRSGAACTRDHAGLGRRAQHSGVRRVCRICARGLYAALGPDREAPG